MRRSSMRRASGLRLAPHRIASRTAGSGDNVLDGCAAREIADGLRASCRIGPMTRTRGELVGDFAGIELGEHSTYTRPASAQSG